MMNREVEALERKLAIDDGIKLARRGLLGCNCDKLGVAMPCRHVMEASDDPFLRVFMRKLLSGSSYEDSLQWASETIAGDPVRFLDFKESRMS